MRTTSNPVRDRAELVIADFEETHSFLPSGARDWLRVRITSALLEQAAESAHEGALHYLSYQTTIPMAPAED